VISCFFLFPLANGETYSGKALIPFIKGCAFHKINNGAVELFRLDPELKKNYPKNAWERGKEYAGIRLEFSTNAPYASISYSNLEKSIYKGFLRRKIAIYRDGSFLAYVKMSDKINGEIKLPLSNTSGESGKYCVYLPFMMHFKILALNTPGQNELLNINNESKTKAVFYGDSITQGCMASGPDRGFPELISKKMNLNCYNLGLAGAGCGEKIVAHTVGNIDADMFIVAFGTNLTSRKLSKEQFQKLHADFLKTIRLKNKTQTILVVSPIFRPGREKRMEKGKLGLVEMRRIEYDNVKKMQDDGDANIHYLNGLDLLGKNDTKLLGDKVHPNDKGYTQIARAIEAQLKSIINIKNSDKNESDSKRHSK
jgi:lysophospholipase L1-like esterase